MAAPMYTPPEWGLDGANAFGIYVEAIKGGVVVENMTLPMDSSKSCVVAGRMEPVCDLVLQHPSISRMHAVLQFDAQGALFLRDLKSTHGTFVNKKRIVANEYVRLHIGDVIVFGESTRLYAICGPPELLPAEYDSLNLQKFREKSDIAAAFGILNYVGIQSAKREEVKATQRREESDGASWGFGEDAPVEEEDDEDASDDSEEETRTKEKLPDYLRNLKEDESPYKSSLKQTEINDKDQKLFQQLQTRIKKMENLKLEKSRIQAKQNQLTGLTEGQERTLERNEQRIQALRKEIEDIEDRIHAKNAQREKTKTTAASAAVAASVARRKKQNASDALYGYGSDEDDFYDRTKSNQRKHLERKQEVGVGNGTAPSASSSAARGVHSDATKQSEVLTADSIQTKINALEKELREVGEAYAAQMAASAPASQEHKQEEVDSLDSFMESTTRELHTAQLSSIHARRQDLENELRRQRQLLVVATPALASLSAQQSRSEPRPIAEKSSASPSQLPHQQKARVDVTSTKAVQDDVSKSLETSPLKRAIASESRKSESLVQESVDEENPVVELAAKTRDTKAETAFVPARTSPSAQKKRKVVGPTLGPAKPPAAVSSRQRSATNVMETQRVSEGSTLEGGDRVWVPPTNQTGDGRTKLNDKYGY